jgi:hypothetical protein
MFRAKRRCEMCSAVEGERHHDNTVDWDALPLLDRRLVTLNTINVEGKPKLVCMLCEEGLRGMPIVSIINFPYMTDSDAFFWFKVPDGFFPNDFRYELPEEIRVNNAGTGISFEVFCIPTKRGHMIDFHGPFDTEAECNRTLTGWPARYHNPITKYHTVPNRT